MAENISDTIDDLFRQLRLKLIKVRESDPQTSDELKNLLLQLEDWVEKLVVDSLRLQSLEKKGKR
jgi:hypothetical protein